MNHQRRIVELQRSLRIARNALERIQAGRRNAENIAAEALEELFKLEQKQPLQGIMGHGRQG